MVYVGLPGRFLFDLLNGDFYYDLFYLRGLMEEHFRLMDIRGEENNELAGGQGDIAEVFFLHGIECYVFFGVIGGGGGLVDQGGVSKSFSPGDHDLDIGIFPMAFRLAF